MGKFSGLSDLHRRDMGKLNAGNKAYIHHFTQPFCHFTDAWNDKVNIGKVSVVGEPQSLKPFGFGPSCKL